MSEEEKMDIPPLPEKGEKEETNNKIEGEIKVEKEIEAPPMPEEEPVVKMKGAELDKEEDEPVIKMKGAEIKAPEEEKEEVEAPEEEEKEEERLTSIFALRTTANREDQVVDFITSNIIKKKLEVYSVIRPHGMRGYVFVEAGTRSDAEQAAFNVPYARGLLKHEIEYKEIEHMLEQVKKDVNIQKNDIAEIISGPFKREKCKITRIDKGKEEVVVELLEAAVPIPITVKMDAVRVIRRDTEEEDE